MKKQLLNIGFIIFLSMALLGCRKEAWEISITQRSCICPKIGYMYTTKNKIELSINEEFFSIPESFETDLASIPRWYWPILSPHYTSFVIPAIIHDYFYRCVPYKSKKFADNVLYQSLINDGVSHYSASKFYWGVKLFGGPFYKPAYNNKGC